MQNPPSASFILSPPLLTWPLKTAPPILPTQTSSSRSCSARQNTLPVAPTLSLRRASGEQTCHYTAASFALCPTSSNGKRAYHGRQGSPVSPRRKNRSIATLQWRVPPRPNQPVSTSPSGWKAPISRPQTHTATTRPSVSLPARGSAGLWP